MYIYISVKYYGLSLGSDRGEWCPFTSRGLLPQEFKVAIGNSSSSIPFSFSLLHKLFTSSEVLNTLLASSGEIKDIAEVSVVLQTIYQSWENFCSGKKINKINSFFSWYFVFIILDNKMYSKLLYQEFLENYKRHLHIAALEGEGVTIPEGFQAKDRHWVTWSRLVAGMGWWLD